MPITLLGVVLMQFSGGFAQPQAGDANQRLADAQARRAVILNTVAFDVAIEYMIPRRHDVMCYLENGERLLTTFKTGGSHNCTHRIALDGPRARLELFRPIRNAGTTRFHQKPMIYATNGKNTVQFFPLGIGSGDRQPAFHYLSGIELPLSSLDLAPVSHHACAGRNGLDPLTGGLTFTGRLSIAGGALCHEFDAPESAGLRRKYFYDLTNGGLLRAIEWHVRGEMVERIAIAYSRHESLGLLPSEWTREIDPEEAVNLHWIRGRLTVVSAAGPFDEGYFAPLPPPGAMVADTVAGENYEVSLSGRRLPLPQSGGPQPLSFSLIAAAAVACLLILAPLAFLLARRRSQASAG